VNRGTAEGGGLILVAEHEPAVAELERRYLTREGYAVEIEPDPSRAAAVAARVRPDAVVLDVMLPDIDGLQVMRRIRAAGADVPVQQGASR